ncbi:2-oxoacid:ferredoxin oxidoreductase subunit beta [Candidatus Woesearchaeota archaeon]|nr:2-oxoacid:ferredoxin oxidoreductase subunit beta [Candidatus Woesearchaeota archaeon]
MNPEEFNTKEEVTWCPGCGNHSIFMALKQALVNLNIAPDQVIIAYGIGCHGHEVNYLRTNGFEGLHGRPVPVAEGIKLANNELNVIAVSGDGDAYGEGLSHMINAARGNHNVTYLVHDNRVYGLTTGQTSPTSAKGTKSKSTPEGAIDEPINPMAMAIAAGATFVARTFAGNIQLTTELIMQAIKHNGFALLDILQPCVSFNKVNNFQWYMEHTYKLENHNPADKVAALQKALEMEKLPLGVLYKEEKPSYEEQVSELSEGPLTKKSLEVDKEKIMEEFL